MLDSVLWVYEEKVFVAQSRGTGHCNIYAQETGFRMDLRCMEGFVSGLWVFLTGFTGDDVLHIK